MIVKQAFSVVTVVDCLNPVENCGWCIIIFFAFHSANSPYDPQDTDILLVVALLFAHMVNLKFGTRTEGVVFRFAYFKI